MLEQAQHRRRTGKFHSTRITLITMLSTLVLATTCTATTIEFWFPSNVGNAQTQAWLETEVIPRFQATHPPIEVAARLVSGYAQYEEQLLVAHASATGPDVFVTPGRGPDEFAANGMISPLDRFVAEWGETSDYVPAAWNANTFDGVPYAIPWSIQGRTQQAHGALLDEAGLAREVAETWDDLRVMASRLTRVEGDSLVQWGFNMNPNHHNFYVWVHTAGGRLFTEDFSTPAINSVEARNALELMVEVYTATTRGLPTGGLNFNNQGVVMRLGEPNQIGNLYSVNPDIAANIIVGPPARNVQHASRVYVPSLAISPHSDDMQAAWDWVAFLQRPEHLLTHNNLIGRLPPRLSLLRPDNFYSAPQLMQVAQVFVDYGIPHRFPAVPGQQLFDIVTEQLRAAISEETSPEAALEKIDRAWRSIMQ